MCGNGQAADLDKQFVSRVLGDTEDVWMTAFNDLGRSAYAPPTVVIYATQAASACGVRRGTESPFYCPGDRRIYVDLGYFSAHQQAWGPNADAVAAYLIAREVGRHVQLTLGTIDAVDKARAGATTNQRRRLAADLELQPDCFAGVWMHSARKRGLLEPGDAEKGPPAAQAVHAGRRGSSAQRAAWFRRGFDGGDPRHCDIPLP